MVSRSDVKAEWLKVPVTTPVTFVGSKIVCMGKGCHLLFYNLSNNEEYIYAANDYEEGDGVQCYAGHSQLSILAFAEKMLNPRIFIITIPEFVKLTIIENGAPEGYLAMTFSEQSYLITLSDLPVFELVIWNWRTADKLFNINTELNLPNQVLCCSIHSFIPIVVAQYAENHTELILWEIHSCFKLCNAIKHKVVMPQKDKIRSCAWNNEGTLFVLNNLGNIYQVYTDYTVEVIIFGGLNTGTEIPCFTCFKGGFLVYLTNMDIKYFKKSCGAWYEEWSVTSIKLNKLLSCSAKDMVIGWSACAEIMELDLTKRCFVIRKSCETTYEQICLIYPACNYFATVCINNCANLKLFECLTGNEVGKLEFDDIILVIAANPVYPYVACGLVCGTMTLVNCYKPNRPSVLTNFCLYRQEINKIIFNNKGDVIITANLARGSFFIIQGVPGSVMQVLIFIDYKHITIDISLYEDEKYIHLYILPQTDKCLPISQKIIVKSLLKGTTKVKKSKYMIEKYKITHLRIVDNNIFIANIFKSKNVCILQFLKTSLNVLKEVNCGHYLPEFSLECDNDHVYTCGYDGLIIIKSIDFNTIVGGLLPHHRYTGGVKTVQIDPFMRFVLSYGSRSKELVCTKFLKKSIADHIVKEKNKIFTEMRTLFTDMIPTVGFEPKDDFFEDKAGKKRPKTYLEVEKKNLVKQEEIECAQERQAIMEEFLVLKKEVVTLLEQNLNGPELEKIDILEFYQHTLLRQHKEEMNKKKCEWTVLYYKDLIRAQDEIRQFMKKKFFDSMAVTGTLIKGIFSNFSVESYSTLPGAGKYMQSAKTAAMFRQYEDMLREGDLFRPWEPMPERVILQKLENPPIIKVKSESARIMEALEDLDSLEVSSSEIRLDTTSCYPSNTVSYFIEPCKSLYEQDEIHAYMQIIFQLKLMEADHEILKNLFNEKYADMKQQKVRDMNVIIEKISRLKFILSELGNHSIEIKEPRWNTSEYTENIITVKDSEIGITPYISPSEQAILDWQAAEDERIRLLLLADDFRERALMKMMDGVLEVRWEDTLKRDIPKPKCMLEKDPLVFNEDDLRAVKDYEDKVAFLNSERQMYRNMLETEYSKTAEQVRETIKKFNTRCRDLLLMKIKIESARMQQSFVMQRLQTNSVQRMDKKEEERNIIENIKSNEKYLVEIHQKIAELNEISAECKIAGEALVAKDKILEKNFKRDFQDFSALTQEQSFKLYKKQPKMSSKGITVVPLLLELGTCCANQEKSLLLNNDCLDFLKSIDNLDQYVGVPNTIDETMYKMICKHRRFRIENELKIKANTIDQNCVETAIIAYQKYLASQKEFGVKLVTTLQDKRQEKLEFTHDKTLQIVMRKGLVEIPIDGEISDFENAILIHRKDVETINGIILKAGARKLQVMNDKMIHRRGILMKEWEHKKMKMEIEDLNTQIYLIEHIKVTKEIQQYLRQKAKGESYDKGTLTLDQEIESKKKSYEQIIAERHSAINELDKQIKNYKKKNKILDKQIAEINVDVCEKQESRDREFETKHEQESKYRMTAIVKRSRLVKQIQEQHNEILVLQTELELLRLKTYPTLKFKTLF